MKYEMLTQSIDLLLRLCAIERFSRGEQAAADMLEQYMRCRLNLQTQRHGNNLWCVKEAVNPSAPTQTILLNAHIDTVRPASGWASDPLQPIVEHIDTEQGPDTRITALGSNDDGASLVSLLHVFAALPPQPYNIIFAATAEEEVSGQNGIASILPLLPQIDVAIVGEPTCMQPAIAEKGLMVIDAVAHGRAGHAARDEGDNAIYKAMRDIARLQNSAEIFTRISPLLGTVKTTVTIINAGTQHNVVPAECHYTIDVRSNELYTNHEIFTLLESQLESQLTARSFRLSSSSISRQNPLVCRAIALGGIPFGSPTLSDQALLPFASMKMGPGDSRRSHTAGEYILASEIKQAIELYTQLLMGIN